jgi:hypothetical protein
MRGPRFRRWQRARCEGKRRSIRPRQEPRAKAPTAPSSGSVARGARSSVPPAGRADADDANVHGGGWWARARSSPRGRRLGERRPCDGAGGRRMRCEVTVGARATRRVVSAECGVNHSAQSPLPGRGAKRNRWLGVRRSRGFAGLRFAAAGFTPGYVQVPRWGTRRRVRG